MDFLATWLVGLGALVFFGSIAWLHVRGFKDSAFPDPILLLTGVSLIAYAVTRWDRAKVPTLLAVGGLVLMFGGPPVSGLFLPRWRALRAYNQGVEAIDREDYDEAIASFTEAIRLDPQLGAAYGNRGVAHGEKGDFDKAIADFSQLIRLEPNNGWAYFARAVAYNEKGEQTKAEADLAAAEQLGYKPDDAQRLPAESEP